MPDDDHLWHIEESFHSQERKASRKERKRISQKDRSKYKKSDQDQLKKQTSQPLTDPELKIGRVMAIVKEGVVISFEEKEFLCSLKGGLKKEELRVKNLVAVGDLVQFKESAANEGSIVRVLPRHSILSRADNLSRNKEQLIAVNIDQVLITTSVVLPPFKPPLIDRYIIAAKKGKMQPIILINKIDLFSHPPEGIDPAFIAAEKEQYERFVSTYTALGYPVISLSIKTEEGLQQLEEIMQNKTSVFSGQSGVGKSSLINRITGTTLATGGIVARTRKGSHTTTTTHLVPLTSGGFCVDTPGIKSFGLWDLHVKDLSSYFPEILAHSSACKFPDCAHLNEPDCAVKRAVEEGAISPLRFESYCALMASLSEKHKNR